MLFQLRNLSEGQQQLMMDAPILVGILIGSADGKFTAKEIQRLRDVLKTKGYSVKNDVHLLYKKLGIEELDEHVSRLTALTAAHGTTEEKAAYLIGELSKLNPILSKLDPTYAKQYRETLHAIAVAIANSTGGVLGLGTVSHEEEDLIDLPFINKIR